MSVVSLHGEYKGKVLDKKDNFHGNQVTYLHWEDHNMFCAAMAFPLPPDMPFGAILENLIPEYYGMHPDFSKIDWNEVKWKLDGKDFVPDPTKGIAEQGFEHKSLLRFWTPGLKGSAGSCS